MDPNATLKNIREAVGELRNQDDDGVLDDTSQVGFLLESVEALDEWLGKGGFLPTAWQRAGQGDADDVTIRPTTTCGCGSPLVWVGGHWEHDAAPYLWGDDHEPNEPPPTGGAREYWDEEDGVDD